MDQWLHLICQELNNLIPPRSVRDHGRATGLIERYRDIKATPFLWMFLIGTTQADSSVSAVRDLYKAFTDDDVVYSSIQQWITPDLTDLLTDLVDYVSVELGRTEASLGGRYDRFRDVLIPDATICTLSPESVEGFPGFGDDPAGAKLHLVESLASVAPVLDSITSARTQETTQFEVGEWIEDSLAMFDLGYLDYGRLGRIEDNDGWFVCRLNADANPHVINESRTVRGNSIDLEGTHLQEMLPALYRQTIDITATVGADRSDPHLPSDRYCRYRGVADIYVFKKGIDQSDVEPWGGGPFGYQIDIIDSVPGEEKYTPLRHPHLVTWNEDAEPEILESVDELMQAKEAGRLTIKSTDIVVSAPIVSWPGDPFGQNLHMSRGPSESMEQMMERMAEMMQQMDEQQDDGSSGT